MPYKNLPKSKTKKMERCVAEVKEKGGAKNPYAVCHASIMGKLKSRFKKKIKKK